MLDGARFEPSSLRGLEEFSHVEGIFAQRGKGTPVLDLEPHMTEFDARGEVRRPASSHELMRGYW